MNIKILANILTTLCVMLAISSCNNNHLNNQLLTADECLNHEQVDSAYHILKNIDQKKISDKENLALYTLLYTKARYKMDIPVKDNSIDSAISYYKGHGPAKRLAEAYNYKGMTISFYQHDAKKAIEYLKKAEAITIRYNLKVIRQRVAENICIVNLGGNYYRTALKYAFKALNYAQNINDNVGIAYDLRYISDAYSNLKMEELAMKYYLKSIDYLKYYTQENQSILLGNIGEYYFKKGQVDKADSFLKKAFSKKPNVYTYSVVADIYIKDGEYEEAKSLMKKAPKPETYIDKLKMLSTLYDLNRKSGNLTQALSIADSIFALNQQMENAKEHDNLNEIQAEYDREFVAQTWMDRLIYMGAALVILVLLIILLIIRQRYKTTKVQNQLMQDRLLMGEYQNRLAKMESAKDSSATEIKEMKKKIGSLESKIYKTLQHGRECYEQIQNNGNIAKWSAKDLRDFIEYYKLMDLSFMVSLEEEYQPLTPSQCFYLIMTEAMNKDKATVQSIMNISDNALRTIKSRIKNKLVHQKYIK